LRTHRQLIFGFSLLGISISHYSQTLNFNMKTLWGLIGSEGT
jgi:hypothetical protein